MRRLETLLMIAMLAIMFSAAAAAQANGRDELGLTLGAEIIPDRSVANGTRLTLSNGVEFGANFAHRLAGNKTALLLEFPLVAAPSHDVRPALAGSVGSLATLYLTPSLRVQFAHGERFSPWMSAGAGLGWFEGSKKLGSGATNPNRNVYSGTWQFGGGVDVKTPLRILFPISLRGEFRDFYAVDGPNYGAVLSGGRQHNFVVGGGFVVHF